MKRLIVSVLTISLAICLCVNAAFASSWSDDFMKFIEMTKSISQSNTSTYEWTTYLTMCDEKLMFIMVIDAATINRDITQIFFIGSGDTIDLTFDIDDGSTFYLTLPNVDGEYSYHTVYKDEASLVKALGSAEKVKITYATNGSSNEYELSSSEISNLNLVFGFLDEHDFASAVSSSYIEICDANSTLYPMTTK